MADDTDLEVNFDEIDRLKAEDAAKGADAKPKKAAKDDIEVIKDDEPAKKPVLSAEDGLEKLQKQLAAEEASRKAAEARAADAERHAREAAEGERLARTEKQATELDVIKTGIDTATQNKAAYKQEYAAALAAQDFDKAAEVQEKMSENAANLLYLTQSKAQLERAPKPVARAPVDQVEEFVGRIGAEFPRSKEWLRAHPQFVRDPKKNRQMLAAHELAMSRDLKADSPEYFASIEDTLNIAKPATARGNGHDPDDPMADAAQEVTITPEKPARRAAPAAAPVSRSGGGGGSKPNTVRLTPAEVEAAEISGVSLEEYAKQKRNIEQGKLN